MAENKNEESEPTRLERMVKGEKPEWKLMYSKDGISVFSDPIFGRVKLVTPEGGSTAKDVAAVNGVVAFSEYYEGGIGKIEVCIPYFPVTTLNALRGE